MAQWYWFKHTGKQDDPFNQCRVLVCWKFKNYWNSRSKPKQFFFLINSPVLWSWWAQQEWNILHHQVLIWWLCLSRAAALGQSKRKILTAWGIFSEPCQNFWSEAGRKARQTIIVVKHMEEENSNCSSVWQIPNLAARNAGVSSLSLTHAHHLQLKLFCSV